MSDAELIYAALLRAERRLEERAERAPHGTHAVVQQELRPMQLAVLLIREEIGRGLAERSA